VVSLVLGNRPFLQCRKPVATCQSADPVRAPAAQIPVERSRNTRPRSSASSRADPLVEKGTTRPGRFCGGRGTQTLESAYIDGNPIQDGLFCVPKRYTAAFCKRPGRPWDQFAEPTSHDSITLGIGRPHIAVVCAVLLITPSPRRLCHLETNRQLVKLKAQVETKN